VPAVLVLLPALIVLAAVAGTEFLGTVSAVFSGVLALAVLYALGQVLGVLGRRVQDSLFLRWDGAPAVRFMRWRDDKFTREQKEAISRAVRQVLGQALPTPEEESENPQGSDSTTNAVFAGVRSYLHANNVPGPWQVQVAEYGMARNLYASAWLACILGLVAAGIGLIAWWQERSTAVLCATIGALVWVGLIALGRYSVFPTLAKECSERYAESAWLSFLQAASRPARGTS
jgi:hypothetical protein